MLGLDIALLLGLYTLGVTLLTRAARGRFLSDFPLFYGYVIYLLISEIVVVFLYLWAPSEYPTGAWLRLLLSFVAEFAVIVEVSDHIFSPFPAIRQLGRFLTVSISVAFFLVYIFPPFLRALPSEALIVNLFMRSSLTKAVIILALVVAIRLNRLRLSANVSGLLLGFSLYLVMTVANCGVLETLGWERYGETFGYVGSLSFTLGMLIWTVALWRYEPVLGTVPGTIERTRAGASEDLGEQLAKANTALVRLLGK